MFRHGLPCLLVISLLPLLTTCEAGVIHQGCTDGIVLDGLCWPLDCPDRLCSEGFYCNAGSCLEIACRGVDCPSGSTCAGGECYPQDCIWRNCPGLGEVCVAEECQPADCVHVTCPLGQRCANGQCYPIDCTTQECPGYGEVCVDDERCVERSCVGVTCPAGQACAGGYCYPADCTEEGCFGEGEVCVDGVCQRRSCVDVNCQPGFFCANGWCYPNDCPDRNCSDYGEVCYEGNCIHADCVGVNCPAGQRCARGECFDEVCGERACLPEEVCYEGHCLRTNCVGVSCPQGQVCADGECFPADCAELGCGNQEICLDGTCTPRDCAHVPCPSGELCGSDLACHPEDCPTIDCGDYEVCDDDVCVDRLCLDLTCPPGQVCAAGECYTTQCAQPCGAGEVCQDGQCIPTECAGGRCCPAADCTLLNQCAQEYCDPFNYTCLFAAEQGMPIWSESGSVCTDQDPCTTGDSCQADRCLGTQIICDAPPADRCENNTAVTYPAIGQCVGGNCQYPESREDCSFGCLNGTCRGDPCGPVECDAGESCVSGSCRCGGTGPDCQGGDTCCGTECFDLTSNTAHCGSCTNACDAGEQCISGGCRCGGSGPDCTGGEACCTTTCAVLASDENHCGSCNHTCDQAESCEAGTCRCGTTGPDCEGGLSCCGTACFDLASDEANCGTCGRACDPGEQCVGGSCHCGGSGPDCTSGQTCCGTNCVDLTQNPNNCGACNNACGANAHCTSSHCECNGGWGNCNGSWADGCETDTLTSLAHCGGCNQTCSRAHATPICADGNCAIDHCDQFWDNCNGNDADGCETSLETTGNCGSCGTPCSRAHATASCTSGACHISTCDGGWGNCDGIDANGCEQELNTLAHCSACNSTCELDHAGESCSTGSCRVTGCESGWGNCDGQHPNGCETPLNTLTNCGACGTPCDLANANESCAGGSCLITGCISPWDNCNGTNADGCETPLNTLTDCGGCGVPCNLAHASETCGGGSCMIDTCDSLWGNCNGQHSDGCETALTSLANCGGCSVPCNLAHAGESCSTGQCLITTCDSLWGNCDSQQSTGCEASLETLVDCGSCGAGCSRPHATATCTGGSCHIASCDTNWWDIDAVDSTGCECGDTSDRPQNCNDATSSLGTVSSSNTLITISNVLVHRAGYREDQDCYQVVYSRPNPGDGQFRIRLNPNPGNLRFDVWRDGCGAQVCDEDVTFTSDCYSTGGACLSGNNGTFYVCVHALAGQNNLCQSYTLEFAFLAT